MVDLTAFFSLEGTSLTNGATVGQRPLLILPTYNERGNLQQIVDAIHAAVPHLTIWIVDDNSPDGTGDIAEEMAARDPRIAVFHRPGKLGLGTAYAEAFQRALTKDFDAILEMDADFSHDPRYLPELIAGLQDADLVIGSRYIDHGGTENWSALRQAISRTGNRVAQFGLGVRARDATSGFRAFRPSTIARLNFDDLKLRGYGFQIEVVYQVEHRGMTIKEIPIVFVERASGTSKMSKDIVLEAVLHILRRRGEELWRWAKAMTARAAPQSDAAGSSQPSIEEPRQPAGAAPRSEHLDG